MEFLLLFLMLILAPGGAILWNAKARLKLSFSASAGLVRAFYKSAAALALGAFRSAWKGIAPALLFALFAAHSARADVAIKNLLLQGSGSVLQASSTFTLQSTATLTAASGSTVNLSAGTVSLPIGNVTDTIASIARKPPARAVAVANVASLSGTTTIDGVALAAGDPVLLTNQTTTHQNGPWLVNASTWTRPSWYPAGGTLQAFYGANVTILSGTIYSGSEWYITSTGVGIIIGTTATTWAQITWSLSAGGLSGTLPAAQMPAHTGDVTSTVGTVALTIATGAVTDTKGSLANKPIVKAVAVANVASLSGTTTIDTIALAATDPVLLTAQTTASQNGPWLVAAGAWTRPSWFPAAGTTQAFYGATVPVVSGAINAGSRWYITTTAAITIDTTATAWAKIPGNGGSLALLSDVSLGTPTNSQVLTYNGSAWTNSAASGGTVANFGGTLTLLEQHTASASATLDFNACFTSLYDDYLIEFINVLPATSGAFLWMRCSTNGGSTYDTSAIYSYDSFAWRAGGSGVGGATAQGQAILTVSGIDTTAAWGTSGSGHLYNPSSASVYKRFVGRFSVLTGGLRAANDVTATYESTTAVNAVRFLFSTGNITSGTIRIYGLKNTAGGATDYIQASDTKTSGTAGGSPVVTTWTTRALQTVDADTTGAATITTNAITIPAGTYRVKARAPFFASNQTRIRLYDQTNSAVLLYGSSSYFTSATVAGDCWIVGRFTAATSIAVRVEYYATTNTSVNGLGVPLILASVNEVYTQLELTRE